MHVEGKIVHLMEGLVADVALVRFVATVGQLVILVIPLLMESFATEFADEWLVASVNSRVRVEGRRSIECLSACVAFVGLLGGVDYFVAAQCGRLSETFAADLADEWSSSGMNRHVSGQIVVGVEYFATFLAGESLLLPTRSTGTRTWSSAVR